MDPNESEAYEFLDLSEVNDNERNEILSTLTFEQNTRLKPIADPDKDDTVSSASIDPSLLFDDNQRRSSLIKSHQQQINGISTTIKNEQITNDNNNNVANNNNKDVVNQNGYAPLNSNHNSNNNININNNNVLFTTSVSSGRTRLNSSSATGKRFTANSRKSPNNDATIPMSQQSSISNLTATSIDSNISAIDSNSNLVKAHHLPKIEKTQYGQVVRNLMLPRLITPLSLPFYAVVKPTTAKLTELTVVPLRAPVITAGAAVKSHVEHPVKARVNTKTCVASTLKATNTAMAHSQPGSHQVSNQQQQQQQTSPSQQQQQQQQSSQQQLTPAQSATQQSQQIVNTSPSASQQNNNYVPHGGGTSQPPVYNQMHPGNLYMPSHSGGPIYPTVIPAGIPPNVYVNNVTANVNLHGWAAHPVSSYMPGGPQHYMSGELPQAITADQSNQVMQSMQQQCMPANTGRGPRRGRGRNNNNNNRRNDYIQRQQQDSPAPQEICNAPNVDPQTLANAGYSQYAYQYPYQTYYGGPPQNHLIHPQAQQSGVPPLYVASTIPMYPSHPIYNYSPSLIYPSVMHPAEYPFDENSEEQRPGEAMLPQVWHQPIYPEEYVNHEMMAPEEINHNAPSLASSETPSMLSPGYQIYDPQIQQTLELQQQMNVLHIYEEQQIQTHPQHVPQIEDDISECSLQMQADAVMQPIMPSLEQSQPHHILPNQGIPIEASTLDQSTGSDHSLHDIHVTTSTSNAHSPESSAPDSNINQSLHQPIGAINYGKSVPQSPHQQIHQYAPNAISNTKDNIRDYNQNVPNVPLQMNAHVRNQLKENIQNVVPHYNPQVEELPCQAPSIQQTHSSPPQQQQQQLHQQPPPQQQQQSHQPPLQIQQQQPMHQPQNQPGQQLQHQGQNQQSFSQHHRNVNQEHQLQTPIVPPNNTTVQCNDSTLQQTNTAQVVNKTMTWTNSHTKKSTASVAVTATPTSTLKPFSQTKSSSSTFNSTNNNHQQATTTHQPQVKNYGVTKTPSSPVAASHSNNNTSNSIQHQLQSVPSDKKFSGSSTTTEHKAAVSTTSIASTVVPQQLQPQLPVESSRPQTTQPTTTQQAKKTEMLNLAPPISTQSPSTTTSSPSQSWASLFVSANTTNFTTSLSASSNSGPALPPPFSAKKPIAKVAPYEGITPVQPPPIVTPGAMSYSAASAQGLLQSNANQNKQKSTIDPATPQLNRNNNIDEGSYKFAAFLTKFETDFTPVSLKPRGLTNPSNYCYINSILQALMACAPFYNLIKSISKQHSLPCSEVKTPTINAMLQFISEFTLLPQGFRQNRPQKQQKGKDETGIDLQCDSAFEPTAIYKLWNDSRDEHAEGRQEDAEEFLGFILNKLNDEMLEIIKCAKPAPEQNGGEQTSENEEGAVWQMILNNRNKVSATRQTDFGKTPLSDIFRGELRSRLQREGEHSTDVIQPFFTLQLNIEKAASVKEALEILVGRDQLEGVTGSKSKQEVVAWQQMSLEKLPLVLILHLKWFDYKSDGCTKIVKTVEFPVELKIDAKILASKKYNPKLRVYRLFAVVYHDGKEACKGHYITDVYHTGYCSWLRFNDNTVKPISENNVLRPRESRVPYLLYYRRVNK